MKNLSGPRSYRINNTEKILEIENVNIEGDLIVTRECKNLKELRLYGDIFVSGEIICEIDNCDLVAITTIWYVCGLTGILDTTKTFTLTQSSPLRPKRGVSGFSTVTIQNG